MFYVNIIILYVKIIFFVDYILCRLYSLQVAETKIAECANSVDLGEVAHNQPPHLDLHFLPSSLCILKLIST